MERTVQFFVMRSEGKKLLANTSIGTFKTAKQILQRFKHLLFVVCEEASISYQVALY